MQQSGEPVPFTINGMESCAEPGETVLRVARRLGVSIPTLCHHDALTPHGGCRLCVVEVFWGKRSKLVTSCIYMPYEGDRIETDNERIHKTRRLVLELLLARCPNVELLWEMAHAYGITEGRFARNEEAEDERCIQCGLCVRVCDEIVGQHAIGYANRGTERRIMSPFNEQSGACIGCAACVYICPTGALHYTDEAGDRILPELNTRVSLSQCRECGSRYAPSVLIEKVARKIARVETAEDMCPACRRRAYGKEAARLLGNKNLALHGVLDSGAYRRHNRHHNTPVLAEVANKGPNAVS